MIIPRQTCNGVPSVRITSLPESSSVHAFVDHAGNFHITSKRQPSDTVFSFAYFLFQNREVRIEKEVEFFYPRFEKFRRKKMTALMQYNEQRQTQQQLKRENHTVKFEVRRYNLHSRTNRAACYKLLRVMKRRTYLPMTSNSRLTRVPGSRLRKFVCS